MGPRKGPPKWYWEVEPAKTIYERFKKDRHKLECWNPNCKSVGRFCKDSNGKGQGTYGCIKCSVCEKKIRASKFFIKSMKGSKDDPILKLEARSVHFKEPEDPTTSRPAIPHVLPPSPGTWPSDDESDSDYVGDEHTASGEDFESDTDSEGSEDSGDRYLRSDQEILVSDTEMLDISTDLLPPKTSAIPPKTTAAPTKIEYAHPSMGAAKFFELSDEFKKECPEAVAKNPIPEHSEEDIPADHPENNQIQVESSDEEFSTSRFATLSETEE
ncbi:hypothetical protein BB558_002208, partial [Smittium angustum]